MRPRPHASKPSIPMIEFISPALNFSTSLMVSEKKRRRVEKKVQPAIYFLLSIIGDRGEDKDKYRQAESGIKVRKMTPLDPGAGFHYLM